MFTKPEEVNTQNYLQKKEEEILDRIFNFTNLEQCECQRKINN